MRSPISSLHQDMTQLAAGLSPRLWDCSVHVYALRPAIMTLRLKYRVLCGMSNEDLSPRPRCAEVCREVCEGYANGATQDILTVG